ncbi:MAG: YHS domain-containing protein [Candidatus Omnitrophica bacterium]|nr:YHS domain-containing protein [Candidatus Omnitrophota bacterium]
MCPVTGEKIDEKAKVTYEYKGKIYNFCCSACIPEFKKDPEKYIKKVEEELKGKSQSVSEPSKKHDDNNH